jgi:hypothetical protein
MNLEPLHGAAAEMTSLFHQLLQSVTDTSPIWPSQGIDGSSLLMPALAGIAAAMTVALMLAIYFQSGYRSYRDMIRHGLAAALGLSLLAFVIYDMRNAALAHIAKTQLRPAAEFQLQWQQTAERAKTLATEMASRTRALPGAHQG